MRLNFEQQLHEKSPERCCRNPQKPWCEGLREYPSGEKLEPETQKSDNFVLLFLKGLFAVSFLNLSFQHNEGHWWKYSINAALALNMETIVLKISKNKPNCIYNQCACDHVVSTSEEKRTFGHCLQIIPVIVDKLVKVGWRSGAPKSFLRTPIRWVVT